MVWNPEQVVSEELHDPQLEEGVLPEMLRQVELGVAVLQEVSGQQGWGELQRQVAVAAVAEEGARHHLMQVVGLQESLLLLSSMASALIRHLYQGTLKQAWHWRLRPQIWE